MMKTWPKWFPKEVPPEPERWDEERRDALRTLVRYLKGSQEYKSNDFGVNKNRLYDFIRRRSNLNASADDRDKRKELSSLYKAVHYAIAADLNNLSADEHRPMADLIHIVYGGRAADPSGDQRGRRNLQKRSIDLLYSALGISIDARQRMMPNIVGVYSLYALADERDQPRQVERSVLTIWSGIDHELAFEIFYRNDHGSREDYSRIGGIVVPCQLGFALVGADAGTGGSPSLHIFGANDASGPVNVYKGVGLRVNTSEEMISCRVFTERWAGCAVGATKDQRKDVYEKAKKEIQAQDGHIVRGWNATPDERDDWLDNRVDNDSRFVLMGRGWRGVAQRVGKPRLAAAKSAKRESDKKFRHRSVEKERRKQESEK